MSMMSAKNLRDSILQMAVEGKLVEQRDEEGSAADLLASIREQRAQLVREKKAKPIKGGESVIWRDDAGHWFERRGKGEAVCIDEEIPFDIPDSWCWTRLESISNFGSCLNIEYESVSAGTWNLDLEDVEKDSGVILRKKYKRNDEQASTKHVFTEGMVLYSKLRPYLNKVVVADENGVCSSEILPIQFEGLEARCAQVFLMSPYFLAFANTHVSGTKMPRLRVADGKQCLMPIPSLAEQNRIVVKVDELMPHVDEYGKAQEQRERLDRELPVKLRKSILQAAVEGKLIEQSDDDEPASVLLAGIREQRAQLVREKKAKPIKGDESLIYRDDAGHWFERRGKSDPICIDEEIPFDIPDSWSWARLNGLASFAGGKTPATADSSNYEENGILWVTSKDMKRDHIDSTLITLSTKGAADLTLYPAGTILMVTRSGILRRMLPVAILDKEATINQDQKAICPFSSDLAAWLFTYFKANDARIRREFGKSGTTVESINFNQVETMLVAIPPLAEQEHIVSKVDAALEQLNALR